MQIVYNGATYTLCDFGSGAQWGAVAAAADSSGRRYITLPTAHSVSLARTGTTAATVQLVVGNSNYSGAYAYFYHMLVDGSTRTVAHVGASNGTPSKPITLAAATYTVTYAPGTYGTGSQVTATKTYGVALTLPGETFTRTGYTQKGWASDAAGTTKVYDLAGSYTANADVALYPYWQAAGVASIGDGTAYSNCIPYIVDGGVWTIASAYVAADGTWTIA